MPNSSNGQAHPSDSAGLFERMKEEICSQLKLEIQSGSIELSVKLSQEIQSLGLQGSAKPVMNKDKDCASNFGIQQEMLPPVCNMDSRITNASCVAKYVSAASTIDSRFTSLEMPSASSGEEIWRRRVSQDVERYRSRRLPGIEGFKHRSFTDIPDSCLARFVLSRLFTLLNLFLVVLNAIWMGYENDIRAERQYRTHRKWQNNVDWAFTLWFIVEILLKITALRLHFFFGKDWNWNLFDLAIVLSSIPGLFLGVVNMVFLRVVRLARISRALRLIRLAKFVTSLREILLSLFLTLGSLFWSFVAIVLTTYIFALLFMQWINVGEWEGIQYSNDVTEKFQSTLDAMLTLFSFISGGQDWYDLLKKFDQQSDIPAKIMLTFYVFFVSFGLVNVITGVFVARAAEATRDDYHLRVAKGQERVNQQVKDLMKVFDEIDRERAGIIDRNMFNTYFQNSHGQYILQSLGLQLNDISKLWHVLESQDGMYDDVVDAAGFVMGVMRLSGEAKSTELVIRATLRDIVRSNKKLCVSEPPHAPEYPAATALSGSDLGPSLHSNEELCVSEPAHHASGNLASAPLSGSDLVQQTPSKEDVRFAL